LLAGFPTATRRRGTLSFILGMTNIFSTYRGQDCGDFITKSVAHLANHRLPPSERNPLRPLPGANKTIAFVHAADLPRRFAQSEHNRFGY